MVAKGANQFDMAYLADFFILLSKAKPDQFIPFSDIVSSDSQKGVEGTITKLGQKVKSHQPSLCGFVSLIEWHIEWHIEDSFPVSSGFVCLNETHSEE